MAAIASLLSDIADSFKSILNTTEFGSEYELLCTELSLQSLRLRLWGESVGFHVDDPDNTEVSILNRPDVPEIRTTVTQAFNGIAFLLSDIEELRRKYDRSASRSPSFGSFKQVVRVYYLPISPASPTLSFREKLWDSHKQKPLISIAKWKSSDAKRFEEKVGRVKGLIDSLESVSKAAASTTSHKSLPPSYGYDRRPPSYGDPTLPMETPSSRVRPTSDSTLSRPAPSDKSRPIPRAPSSISPDSQDTFTEQQIAFKTYLVGLRQVDRSQSRLRSKLAQLSSEQFKDLRTDIYDELIRRQGWQSENYDHYDILTGSSEDEFESSWLPEQPGFHPKRNTARRRLSQLSLYRFRDITLDILSEMERRLTLPLPLPTPPTSPASMAVSTTSPAVLTSPISPIPNRIRQSPPDFVTSFRTPTSTPIQTPPDAPVSSAFSTFSTCTTFSASSIYSSSSNSSAPATTPAENYETFRVTNEETTRDILPLALAKYGIRGDWQDYKLWLTHGDIERCLEMSEIPLISFKQLKRDGKKPVFMLRKMRRRMTPIAELSSTSLKEDEM